MKSTRETEIVRCRPIYLIYLISAAWSSRAATLSGPADFFYSVLPVTVKNKATLPVFQIEVFTALQTRFGPSKYTSPKQPFKTLPQIENEDIT